MKTLWMALLVVLLGTSYDCHALAEARTRVADDNGRGLTFQSGFGHDWGARAIGSNTTQVFTIENTSSVNILTGLSGAGLAAPFQWEGGTFPGTSGDCLPALAASSTCDVAITFSPTAGVVYNDWAEVSYTESGVTKQVLFQVSGYGGGCSMVPLVSSYGKILFPSVTSSTVLTGNYFTASSTVTIPGLTVSALTYNDPTSLSFDITSGAATGFFNVEVTNECGTTTLANAVEVRTPGWIDLRTGGDSTASLGLAMSTGVTAVRDATGMYFTGGTSGWGEYVHFTNWEFTRGDYSALEWVFVKNSSSTFMIGIGSDEQDFGSASQWNQAEVQLYTYTNIMWGYYGNNGTPGGTWSQADNATFNYGTYYKVRFNNDGATGNNIVVYQVTAGDWDTNLATFNTTASNNTANATNLRPMILPNQMGNAYRAVAFRLYP